MTLKIDLHMHSDASDGSVSPDVLVSRAALSGLNVISVTEHDNINSWQQVQVAARRNQIKVIPGIEMSTSYRGHGVHLLGYDFSTKSNALKSLIDYQYELRVKRVQEILKIFINMGIKIARSSLDLERTSSPGRVHVAQALVADGHVLNVQEAFNKYLRNGQPAYVSLETVSPEEAIRVIHDAGGVTSLAHPIFTENQLELREDFAKMGLDAIEVLHPKHTRKLQADLIQFCQKNGLMITGGSDWHGTLGEDFDLGDWYLKSSQKTCPSQFQDILKDAKPVRQSTQRVAV